LKYVSLFVALQLIGHADVSLQDPFCYLTCPLNTESLTLSTALEHPVLSRMWSAHVTRELSAENLSFYRVVSAYQDWATRSTSLHLLIVMLA
jgi:hypothetical protein